MSFERGARSLLVNSPGGARCSAPSGPARRVCADCGAALVALGPNRRRHTACRYRTNAARQQTRVIDQAIAQHYAALQRARKDRPCD